MWTSRAAARFLAVSVKKNVGLWSPAEAPWNQTDDSQDVLDVKERPDEALADCNERHEPVSLASQRPSGRDRTPSRNARECLVMCLAFDLLCPVHLRRQDEDEQERRRAGSSHERPFANALELHLPWKVPEHLVE